MAFKFIQSVCPHLIGSDWGFSTESSKVDVWCSICGKMLTLTLEELKAKRPDRYWHIRKIIHETSGKDISEEVNNG